MRLQIIIYLPLLMATSLAWPGTGVGKARANDVAELRYPSDCILRIAADRLSARLRSDVPAPDLRFASQVTLREFQDAVESLWGFRPDAVTSAYIPKLNRIYLMDDASYYRKTGRFVDDSLAHELTHFIQVRYRGYDLGSEEFAEMEAIEVQTWFRESYLAKGVDPAEACAP